jgi:hypothetical protein
MGWDRLAIQGRSSYAEIKVIRNPKIGSIPEHFGSNPVDLAAIYIQKDAVSDVG